MVLDGVDTVKRIVDFLNKHRLSLKNKTIIVGVSGGPDSIALLHALKRTVPGSARLIAAHVDHMFRGEESKTDLRFVQRFCESEKIECEAVQMNVSQFAKAEQMNKQAAARVCRYRFFEEVMRKYKASYLALGHHGDDQIETMLMRLSKGTVGKGLSGIRPVRSFGPGFIIRPFLSISKDEIIDYCRKQHLEFRTDPSNDEDDYTRNRFRKYVLPFLKSESAQVHKHFQYASDTLADDEAYLQAITREKMKQVIKHQSSQSVEIDLDRLAELPLPLQRRGILLLLNYLYENVPLTFASIHIETFLEWVSQNNSSGSLDFPNGLKVIKSYESCIFSFNHSLNEQHKSFFFQIDRLNGYRLQLPNHSFLEFSTQDNQSAGSEKNTFVISLSKTLLPLYVRSRRPGDRIQVKGMNGSKKVKDIFIDEKIPRSERDIWPILTNANHEILWLPGLKKSVFDEPGASINDRIVIKYRQHENCRGQLNE